MHPKVHVWFAGQLVVDNEHQLVTVIGDVVLLDQVAQGQNVSDGSLAELHFLVVAIKHCLMAYHHRSTIALQSHTGW